MRPVLGLAGFWLAGVLVTWLLPLGDPPKNALKGAYYRNAREMRDYINNNPIAGLLTRLLVIRTELSDLREVPNSCDGGTDAALRGYTNVVGTVTDYAIWAIPVQRYGTSCAGLMITRPTMRFVGVKSPEQQSVLCCIERGRS